MINLFTDKSLIPKEMELILDIDSFFNECVYSNLIAYDDFDRYILQVIDKSYLSDMIGHVNTVFGYNVPLSYVSTGAKTLMLINHFGFDNVIDISQCGENALEIAFTLDNKYYYLSYCNTANVSVPILVDNIKICNDEIDLLEVWG